MSLAGQSTKAWGTAAGVVILALSGLFGGLDTAKKPPVGVGVEIVTPTWKVTILSARAIASHPKMLATNKTNHMLTVTAKVEILAKTSWTAGGGRGLRIGDILRLTGVTGIVKESKNYGLPMTPPSGVLLKRDNDTTQMLHPGLSEEVEFFWEQAASTTPPKDLVLHVQSMIWRADTLTNYKDWKVDDRRKVEVAVAVSDQRATTKRAES